MNTDLTLSLTTNPKTNSIWSSQVQVKEGDSFVTTHVSSDVPPTDSPTRWVRRHSRLSVPVLKSLLQKAIRRQLPCRAVAMELADKSVGDLVRRLPIIMVEDTLLHAPDFCFLTWLTMAYAKGYENWDVRVWQRLWQCVDRMNACPYRDAPSGDDLEECSILELTKAKTISTPLWCLLVRAEYGGMRFDVAMLRNFAKVWKHRGSFVQDWDAQIEWKPVDCLTLDDVCLAGIDFHCSNVLEDVFRDDDKLRHLRADLLFLEESSTKVEVLWKQCIWNFMSGVNHRRLWSDSGEHQDAERLNSKPYYELWTTYMETKVEWFQKRYLEQRLV